MARPKKNNADYFTHDADMRNDVKIKALRRKFSHTGYAVWNYLLETLTDSDFFEIEWEEINIELLAADYDVSVSELTEIVEYCVKIGLLQRVGNKLISQAHQQRLSSLIANRERKRISEEQNINITSNGRVMASQNPVKTDESNTSGNTKQHSKGEESKGEEKREEIRYPYQDIADKWNSICGAYLPKVLKLSEARKQKIKARLKEIGNREAWMPTIEAIFEEVAASDFLKGRNDKGWTATFDWLFDSPKNWVKVLEGNYSNHRGSRKGAQQPEVTLGIGEYIDNTGRRTYGTGKATIPNDAPPRPSERHCWNSSTNQWILL
ncbi:DUF4373 domain-containing protein [Alistipes sp.]|uniref:DUF4373 domain-containing protein n=1 Tax=Alistipes sp. TaxID=1872444 RepID=UPI0025C406D9|nr:DUF4373 domain-containing protein [Alistipes sp.]